MEKFKTVSAGGKVVSTRGEMRLLSEHAGWRQKVEIWLLNDKNNRNGWRYERLDEHRKLFSSTPILVAYVGTKIGDGHNYDEIRNSDGTVTASFMSSTAERIVGLFQDESDIRIEEKDGEKWIVGTGYIWKWYAQELVKKLKRQGLEGMSVSIETLIDEMYMDGSIEVFTKYQILGTTILGDDVTPAVADAHIRTLSELGVGEVRKMTLKVASMNAEALKNPQNKLNEGVKRSMKLKELEPMFPGFRVLSISGRNVALLSDNGTPYVSSAEKSGDEIVVGAKNEIVVNAMFGEGEDAVCVSLDTILEHENSCIAKLQADLESATEARDNALAVLAQMQKAEKNRREQAVRDALKNRMNELTENCGDAVQGNECDSLMSDERVTEYAEMEDKAGYFCGDVQARKDLDALCMDAVLSNNRAKASSARTTYAWDTVSASDPTGDNDYENAIKNIMK